MAKPPVASVRRPVHASTSTISRSPSACTRVVTIRSPCCWSRAPCIAPTAAGPAARSRSNCSCTSAIAPSRTGSPVEATGAVWQSGRALTADAGVLPGTREQRGDDALALAAPLLGVRAEPDRLVARREGLRTLGVRDAVAGHWRRLLLPRAPDRGEGPLTTSVLPSERRRLTHLTGQVARCSMRRFAGDIGADHAGGRVGPARTPRRRAAPASRPSAPGGERRRD